MNSIADVEAALARASTSLATGRQPDTAAALKSLGALGRARDALTLLGPRPITIDGFLDTEDPYLALMLSNVRATSRELIGIEQYEANDPGWLSSAINRMLSRPVPWRTHTSPDDFVIEIPRDVLSVAVVGDWGTGLRTSTAIAQHMTATRPDLTIHLGDVYYSGTVEETTRKFLSTWPVGTLGTYACNGNHEMYSGGEGFFRVILPSPSFVNAKQRASYWCVRTKSWQLIGLDTAYNAKDVLFQKGFLDAAQSAWFSHQLQMGKSKGLHSIVFTHHNPFDMKGTLNGPLLSQMISAALNNTFNLWYWGHEHLAVKYLPVREGSVLFDGRCVGHGGVPYAPDFSKGTSTITVDWSETTLANDPDEPRRGLNGFVFLALSPSGAQETFIDENGAQRSTWSYLT